MGVGKKVKIKSRSTVGSPLFLCEVLVATHCEVLVATHCEDGQCAGSIASPFGDRLIHTRFGQTSMTSKHFLVSSDTFSAIFCVKSGTG